MVPLLQSPPKAAQSKAIEAMKTTFKYSYDEYSITGFVREVAWGDTLPEVRKGLREHCERRGETADFTRTPSIADLEWMDGHKYRLNRH